MYENNFVTAIIAAAGMGSRMQNSINKQFLAIDKIPVLAHTIKKIESSKYVDFIILLIKKTDINYLGQIINKFGIKKNFKIVYGGNQRQDSIYNGLINMPIDTKIVLTHDGARPFVSVNKLDFAIENVFDTGGCTLAVPVKDTIKVAKNGVFVDYTPNRSNLWAIQTPQVFLKNIIMNAYEQAYSENYYGTDDCSLVEKTNKKIKLILSDYNNIKITTPEDLTIAEAINKDNS